MHVIMDRGQLGPARVRRVARSQHTADGSGLRVSDQLAESSLEPVLAQVASFLSPYLSPSDLSSTCHEPDVLGAKVLISTASSILPCPPVRVDLIEEELQSEHNQRWPHSSRSASERDRLFHLVSLDLQCTDLFDVGKVAA